MMRREFARKRLISCHFWLSLTRHGAELGEIPCIFPANREFLNRDEFARDCPLQRGVCCEPDFTGASSGARKQQHRRSWAPTLPASVEFQDPELKPFHPNEGRYQLLIFSQKAVVRGAQHVVDSDAVVGKREQRTSI